MATKKNTPKKIAKKDKTVNGHKAVAKSGRLLPVIQIALYEPIPELTRIKKEIEAQGLKASVLAKDLLSIWFDRQKSKAAKRKAA